MTRPDPETKPDDVGERADAATESNEAQGGLHGSETDHGAEGATRRADEAHADSRTGGLVGLLALALVLLPAGATLAPLAPAHDPNELTVRVVDETGRPIEGASVEVEGERALSDREGLTRWGFGGTLIVSAPARARLELRLSEDLEVVLPSARDLVGQVESIDGVPIAAARVELVTLLPDGMPDERFAVRHVETDVNGRFELVDLPPSPLRVRARALGYAPAVVDLTSEAPEVMLSLEPAAELVGLVFASDGSLAEGATVRLVGSGVWPPREALTDGEGAFAFGDVPPGIYELSARRGADVAMPRRGLPFGAGVAPSSAEGGAPAAVELHLMPGRVLTGRVVDEAGEGIADATLSLTEEVVGLVPREVESGSDGSFRVEGLAANAVWITARAPGHVGASLRATVPGPVELVLARGATIRGRVVDARGAPLANATVRFLGDATLVVGPAPSALQAAGGLGVTAGPVPPIPLDAILAEGETSAPLFASAVVVTSPDGTFVLEGVAPGVGEVQAEQGERASARSGALRLAPGDVREDLELVLPDGGVIEGRIVDARGFPIAGVHVELATEREPWSRRVVANPDGTFRFAGVLGVGVLTARPFDAPAVRRRIEVRDGATEEISLVVETSTVSLALRVFDRSGFPVEGVTLTLRSERADMPLERTGMSAPDGTFVFASLPEARFRLEAHASAGRWTGTVSQFDRELRVVLAPGGTVEGRVVDERGDALPDVAVRVEGVGARVAVSDAFGAFRFDDLAPGDYEVGAELAEHLPARADVVVREGALHQLTLSMSPAGTIEGEIVDVLGDPVPDARVRIEGAPEEVTTDARGRFRAAVAVGFSRVQVRHPSAGLAASGRVRIERGAISEVRLVTDGRLASSTSDATQAGRFVTGVAVRVAVVGGVVRVVERLDASARALRVGDVIVSVDGEQVFAAAQADALLSGPADVPALVAVRRGANERSVRVARTRHLRE